MYGGGLGRGGFVGLLLLACSAAAGGSANQTAVAVITGALAMPSVLHGRLKIPNTKHSTE